MAREKKSRLAGKKVRSKERVEKKERPKKERVKKERTRAAVHAEPELEPDFMEAEATEMQDPVPVGLLIFTAVFLVGAVVLNMLHLGTAYGVGPFS
jgi:hypothetical protein